MKVKSYYASSIEAAMASAELEMGPDAVLITSRRTTGETRSLGDYEVVFGAMNESGSPQAEAAQVGAPAGMELLRRELESMRRALATAWRNASGGSSVPELAYADTLLTEADFAADLKEELLSALEARFREESVYNQARLAGLGDRRRRVHAVESGLSGADGRVAALLREHLATMFDVAPVIETVNGRSILALVGPPGAGKTTSIVKLAIQYGLTARRPTVIISTDSYRVGATEQLRIYAATMGVAFQTVENPGALRQVFEEHRNKGLVLIDTPGFAPADMDVASDLAGFLSASPDIDVHLLLQANLSAANLGKVVDRFAVFSPRKTILSKLDETDSHGGALSQAILANLPVSFVTFGQQIPDDLAAASKERLLSFLGEPDLTVAAPAA